MIIGYFPGAGGNRYLRQLQGLEYSQDAVTYDIKNPLQTFTNRYMLNGIDDQAEIILTHCLNAPRLKMLAPDRELIFLAADMKKCLHREWALEGHNNRYKSESTVNVRIEHYNAIRDDSWPIVTTMEDLLALPGHIAQEVDSSYSDIEVLHNSVEYQQLLSSFATIKWHHNYYLQYPIDYRDATVVDIDKEDTEFTQVMRRQLNVNINPMFKLAWDSYINFGPDASLTEIYERNKK